MFKQWPLASCEFSWGEETSKCWVAWALTIYMGKPEIPVAQSNGSRRSVLKVQKIWTVI